MLLCPERSLCEEVLHSRLTFSRSLRPVVTGQSLASYSPDGGLVSGGSSCFLSDSRQVRLPVSQSVTSLSLSVSQSVSLCFSVCAGHAFSAHTQSLLKASGQSLAIIAPMGDFSLAVTPV